MSTHEVGWWQTRFQT